MPKPKFQIVTDKDSYAEGESEYFAFKDFGERYITLQSYERDGNFVVLHYSDGYRLAIPEHRIQYIAYLGQ
jgi:hypothetical protein